VLFPDIYAVGDRLGVARTPLGVLGLDICADNFYSALALGNALARMGADAILSPSAWAVDADHDNAAEPYGAEWERSYSELARWYDLAVVGVSNVGPVTGGPWAGRRCIGCSLAVGPGPCVLARGPYGADAEALLVVEVETRSDRPRGTAIKKHLEERGLESFGPMGNP
jgi:predicted amidohydrolase